jgi:hypothetical protein
VKRTALSNRLIIIAVLLSICVIFSCGKEREPGRYYSEAGKFSIVFPKDWEIVEGDGVSEPLVEAVSPWEDDEDRFSEYVSVDIEDFSEKMSLEEYFEKVREANSADYPDYEEYDTGDKLINNQIAKWTRFDVGSSEGVMAALGFVMIKGKRGYLISCVSDGSKYDIYKMTFDDIVSSFRIE